MDHKTAAIVLNACNVGQLVVPPDEIVQENACFRLFILEPSGRISPSPDGWRLTLIGLSMRNYGIPEPIWGEK